MISYAELKIQLWFTELQIQIKFDELQIKLIDTEKVCKIKGTDKIQLYGLQSYRLRWRLQSYSTHWVLRVTDTDKGCQSCGCTQRSEYRYKYFNIVIYYRAKNGNFGWSYWNAHRIIIVYDKSTDVIYCTNSLNYAIRN